MAGIDLTPLPPREAIEYFRSKGLAPALSRFDWRDHWREDHARAFVVAKAMQEDVLTAIRAEVDLALAEGRTFEQFASDLEPKLKAFGWWGKQLQRDPLTGEVREVQLGSRNRLRVIFDTNLRTSYAAGRWQRIWRTRAAFPYLEYRQIDRPTKREDHTRFDGLIRPVEDPIWKRIFPPNGWFCGCYVRQVNDRVLEREGKTVSPPFDLDARAYENRRTGETELLPEGVHPGFDTNPGAVWRNLGARHAASDLDLPDNRRALDRALVEEVRARGLRDRDESLAVYDLDGDPDVAVIGWTRSRQGDANRSSVIPTKAMFDAFADPDRRVVAIHDHPSSGSFSPADVRMLLSQPGLAQVVAVGLDGSIYRMAKAGRRVDPDSVWQSALVGLQLAVLDGEIGQADYAGSVAHLFAMLLDRMGVITYRHAMAGVGADRAARLAPVFDRLLARLAP